ncbi:serine/threonine-protein kinase [Roseimaritima ulvae]|uniref:hypothetical protein n=1 Tax=Roseimaritima ulvae TaxID=980254 RepID=UPI000835E133|nr:hypothetical protein [Roseimaritima ulvae]
MSAAEADRVAYLPVSSDRQQDTWLAQPLLKLSGAIESFDAEQLEITVSGETQPTRIRTERIVWVQPGWEDEDARAGMQAYQAGDWPQAIARMLAALKRRPAVWRQEWLSVKLANAAFEAGRYPAAFELIAQLDRKPLPLPMIGQLPIVWSGRTTDAGLIAAAKVKLNAAEPLARLAAASVLLTTTEATTAQRVLEALATDAERPLVAKLADAQLWRQATPVETARSVQRWQAKTDALPPALIHGPMAAIAERLQAAGEAEQAVELWLAVALLSPDPASPQARRAKQAAQQLLRTLGRDPDADRLK